MLVLKTSHHGDELLELDLSVAVLVDLLDNCVHGLSRERVGATEAEHLPDLVRRDDSRAILVEHAESGVQLLLRGHTRLVCGGDDELRVIDEATVIRVHGIEHCLDFLVAHDSAVVLQVALLDLIHAELSVAVLVEGLENLGQIVTLLLAHQLRCNERVRGLLEGDITVEATKVVQGAHRHRSVNLERGELGNPRMLEGICRGRTLIRAIGEQGSDKVFCVLRDCLPDAVIEAERALAHLLHNILIGLSIEGGHSREKNICDDTTGPDVALLVVVLVEDLGSDVVRSAELLVKVAVGVVDEGGAKVDDLDLVELFVLLEQDVLRLQVTMHDISLVAVVDAGEDLLHEDSSIALAELTTLENLVEELTTLADLSDQVIALLVLEELVHLDDVRVVLHIK